MRRPVAWTLPFALAVTPGPAVGSEEPLATARFQEGRFHTELAVNHGFGEIWSHLWVRRGAYPDWVVEPVGPKPQERVQDGELRITWIGHATALIQMDGLNLLTDPIWSPVAGVGFLGERRISAPGVRFEDLPPLDAVLVSHDHYDHLDVKTLRRLAREHRCPAFVPLGNGPLMRQAGFTRIVELDWWSSADVDPRVRVRAVPARHGSQRSPWSENRTLWSGFSIEAPSGKVFFAGDTGWGPHFSQIRRVCGPFRAALLPIGCYEPRAFMAPMHLNPLEALNAARLLEAVTFIPIHYGTFTEGSEGYEGPLRDLQRAAAMDAEPARVRALGRGQAFACPPVPNPPSQR